MHKPNLHTRLFREISSGALLLALAAPGALYAQSAPAGDANADAPRAERGPRGRHGGRGHHGGRHHRGHHHDGQRILDQLDLSGAQLEAIRDIRRETRAQAEALRESGERGEHREAMRALHQAARTRIEAVLTPAQRAQAEALRREGHARRVARHAERIQEALGLTDARTAQVRRVLEASAERRHALRESGQMNREAHDALRNETHARLAEILTPTEMEQLELMRAERREGRGERGERGERGQRGQRGAR
jgi:Spy/CpxP family protein refolding chaperone